MEKTEKCKEEKCPGKLDYHKEFAAMIEVGEERLQPAIVRRIVREHTHWHPLGMERIAERLVIEMHASFCAYSIDQIYHKRNNARAW